jgi:hypothetical protein
MKAYVFAEYTDNLEMIYSRLFVYVNNSTALELVFAQQPIFPTISKTSQT